MADPVIDEIKQRVDIADLVSQTVQLKKQGRYLKGLCPFHQEKTPSFVVYPDQGTFHCFGCGKSGDAFTWLQEREHLDFGEALRRLADRAGVQLPERTAKPPDPEATAAVDALAAAAAWYHEQLLQSPDAAAARQYLVSRGLKHDTVVRFGIGWAPDKWDFLARSLKVRGFSPAQLEDAGLAVSGDHGLHDRFRARVLFPIRSAEGKVTGFGGRVLGAAGPGQPKYLNSPQTRFFDKSATLFALDLARPAIRKEGYAIIVEGYMDAVVPHQEGFTNVVASLGTALTEQQIELLRRYTSNITLALDADAAGQAATLRGLEVARRALAERKRPVPGPVARSGYLQLAAGQLKIATLQGGKDPDEIVRDDPGAWRRLIESAVPMMDHKLEVELSRLDPGDPRSKTAAVQELARFLVQVPDQIEWGHYVDRIAQRLRLDVHAVQAEVARASRAIREEDRQRERREREQRERQQIETRRESGGSPSPEAPIAAAPQDSAPNGESRGAAAGATEARGGQTAGTREEARLLAARTPHARDVTEEHLVVLLAGAPHLVRRMPARLTPEDFRQPECRELYRTVLRFLEGKSPQAAEWATGGNTVAVPARRPEWPRADGRAIGEGRQEAPPSHERGGGAPVSPTGDDPFRSLLDETLLGYYDDLVKTARRLPAQTDSQVEADLAGVVRRIRERNLREQLVEAQYLLEEAGSGDERLALQVQVERLATQLGRVHLEQSRPSLYTSPI
jgi:DNA primase